ncbi:MAG: adenylate/guanylate cyclase domain-containing protein [Actinomycetota bacterium]|jgi:class 3 adenylate cyclase/tetratricopeptide (TPR) repeat protein
MARTQRRVVTVVFADLVGFTTLAERLDAEDVALVQDGYFAGAASAIADHGGQVEKFIGDAVVATFGVPHAGDDDPERAIRAGLAIIETVSWVEAELGLERGTLRVRVGINTGEVVVVHAQDGTWRLAGDAVNVAARLQAAAEPGTIFVGPDTAFAADHAFVTEPVGELALKGKTGTVTARRIVRPRPIPSREWILEGLRAPTIGRGRELAQLDRAQAAAADAAGGLFIIAPPGVGKSRLVDELRRRALVRGVPVWTVRITRTTGTAYEPIADLLQAALGAAVAGPEPRPLLLERLARCGHVGPRAELSAEHTLALLSGAPLDAEPTELWRSWTAMLDAHDGSETPVWIVEDVHLASADVRAFLAHARQEPHRRNRLLVIAGRPAMLPAAEGEPFADFDVLNLEPLTGDATAELVESLTGAGVLPPEVAAAVCTASAGNPLFVEELLRSWLQAGVLRRGDHSALVFTGGGDRLDIPTTVKAIYLGQLDDLPDGPRTVVDTGSVPGTTFPGPALPVLGIDEPDHSLGFLTETGLLTGPHPDLVNAASYTYRHGLLRDTAYAALPRSRRVELHLRFAEWVEGNVRPEAGAEIVAEHLAAAYDESSELTGTGDGLSRAELAARAASWLERAAADRLAGAPQRAAELLARARRLTDPDDAAALRRQLRLGEALRRSGRLEQALRAFADAGDLAVGGADPAAVADAALGYEDALFESRLPRAEWGATGQRLLDAALAANPGADGRRARLLAALGRARVYEGAPQAGAAAGAEALDVARAAGDGSALAYALVSRRAGLTAPEELPVRLAAGEELMRAAHAAGDLEAELEGVRLHFIDLLEAGDIVAAGRAERRATEIITSLRRPLFFWYPPMWRAMGALFAGDFDTAAGLIEHFRAEGDRWHYRDADLVHAVQVLQLHGGRGRADLARPVVEAVAARAPVRSAPILAWCYAQAGMSDDARRQLDVVTADELAAVPDDLSRSYVLSLCAEAAALLDDAAVAARLLPLLEPWAGHNVVLGSGAVCLGAASHFVGLAARTAGDPETAVAHLTEAMTMNDAMAARPAATLSRVELARTLSLLGRPDAALELLERAAVDARRLGMSGAADDVERLLARRALGVRGRP